MSFLARLHGWRPAVTRFNSTATCRSFHYHARSPAAVFPRTSNPWRVHHLDRPRYASSTAEKLASATPDAITIPPLQYGDLAELGLASAWTPAGWIRWSLELINVSTGLPWFWTIVAGTVLWRCVQLPVAIQAVKTTSRLNLIQPQLQKIQKEISEASQLATKQIKVNELHRLQKSVGFRPVVALRSPIIQITLQMGTFFGISKLCRFPIVQLSQSGIAMFPDLTIADPTYILPIVSYTMMRIAMYTMLHQSDMTLKPEYLPWVRVALDTSWIVPLLVLNLPAGLLVYFITTSIFSTLQILLFRIPAVRSMLGMLPRTPRDLKLPGHREAWTHALNAIRGRVQEAKYEAAVKNRR